MTHSSSYCFNCLEDEDGTIKLSQCSKCKVAQYCSPVCQKEHWLTTHKKHCKYLAGEAKFPGWEEHDASDCFACKDAKQALTKYTNVKSEHSLCEADKGDVMKKWFMAQNYGGNGSMELPFSLGEVTSNYLDVTDKMLAASATLLYNMGHREKQDCRTLLKLVYQVLLKRVNYWNSLLRVQHSDIQVFHISEHVLMLIKEASSQLGYKQMDDVDDGVNCWEAFMLVWSVCQSVYRSIT